MNPHLLIALLLYAVAFCDGLFFYFVLRFNPRNAYINKVVAVISSTACLYALFAGIAYTRAAMGLPYDMFYRLCWVGWLALPAVYQCFYYLKNDQSRTAKTVILSLYAFWGLALVLCLTTNWLETGVYSLIPFHGRYGTFERPVRLFATILLLAVIVAFFRTRNQVTGLRKAQLNYFLLGLIIYCTGGSLGTGLFQQFKNGFGFDPALVSLFSLPFVALAFYGITRYRLFDIQIIISDSLSVLLLTLILGGLNLTLYNLFLPYTGHALAVLISVLVVIVVLLKSRLRRLVQGGINDAFVGDKYNYQAILKESTRAITSMLDQHELLNYLAHVMQQSFKIHKACLFLKNDEGRYTLRYDWGIDRNSVSDGELKVEHLIEWFQEKRQIFIKEEQELLMPVEKFNGIYGNFSRIDAQLVLPLFFKSDLIGFFTLGPRTEGQPYVQNDIDILQTLAQQTATAIENSRLYAQALKTDELARSNRELEQFAYVASHDLQEPLRMVASFCQKLEKRYKDKLDADANEYIYFAVDGATRMQKLVDALLMYARVGKKDVEITSVDLNKVLQTILHDLDGKIKDEGATVNVGHLPVIMANEIQMSQLFQNFLTNALKFKGDKKPVVEVSAQKKGQVWEFTVSDNGIGIDEAHYPKLFVIFQRLHARGAYPGTGIGLALCKKIIENYNGRVRLTSKIGQGTTFYFTLNVREASS